MPNEFEQVLEANRKQYFIIEKKFLNFLETVPLEFNPSYVHSPELVSILQDICSEVDGMLKFLIMVFSLKSEGNDFPDIYNSLNRNGMLAIQKITANEWIYPIKPFEILPNSNVPTWWIIYNKSKHDRPYGIKLVTNGHTLNALGGLYVLHYIAHLMIFQEHREKDKLLESKLWLNREPYLRENKNQMISYADFGNPDIVYNMLVSEYEQILIPSFDSSLFKPLTVFIGEPYRLL